MLSIVEELKFDDKGLISAIAQDYKTHQVLMVAYMNKEALDKTLETGKVHYFSRSRNSLWLKGETSGHFQLVKSISIDCDKDSIVVQVDQIDSACHTGEYSCFYRSLTKDGIKDLKSEKNGLKSQNVAILQELYDIITERKSNPKEGSYTNYLFDKGLDKILKKVGEETAEVIIAAKNKSKSEITYETADLFYHLFVLMVENGVELDDIYEELKKRR
jgi:phosphoribosyl-ATP pyrophosphohydrolase/phosphoribosyl-AMP cyclohydrolase